MANTSYFREKMAARGFNIKPGIHPIVPIMLYDAKLAQSMAHDLLDEGIYVIGFSYPMVPKDQARIRVQISAAHTRIAPRPMYRCLYPRWEKGWGNLRRRQFEKMGGIGRMER